MIQAGLNGGLEEVGFSGNDQKCSDCRYIQKIQPVGHAMELDVVM